MNLRDIETQAKALMNLHNVGHLTFGFDNGKRRIGATHFMAGVPVKITLSKHFAALLTPDEIRETVLHEIAHAIAGHKAGHGPAWKAAAIRVGAKPERCATAVTARPEAAVQGKCPNCDFVHQQHRLPMRVSYCPTCVKAGRSQFGNKSDALIWHKNGARVALSDMPARYQTEYKTGRVVRPTRRKPRTLQDYFSY